MKKYVPLLALLITCFIGCKKDSANKKEATKEAFSTAELQNKSAEELRYMRNEVFARKGYVFKSKDLNTYFNKKSWYAPDPNITVVLTNEEQTYVNKIKEFEQKLKQKALLEIEKQKKQSSKIKTDSIEEIALTDATIIEDSIVKKETNSIKEKRGSIEVIDASYDFTDTSGSYELLLTKGEDNTSIYARCTKQDSTTTQEVWKLRDFIIKEDNENEISFIKEVINVSDLDADGFVDPILVYATKGENAYDEGRLKIIIRYKNTKIAIRHKNAILDDERETQIDNEYLKLPKEIKTAVKKIMDTLMKDKYALFNSDILEKITS